ncbi:MAG: sigma-70 family RNA polymerase sigma factor [Pirellulaceae bacterium]
MSQSTSDSGQWLERFRPYLTLLARAHLGGCGGRVDASDVVQQTLLNAFAKRTQYRGSTDAELAAWLRQILKHNLIDAARAERREKRDVRRELSLEGDIEGAFSRADQGLISVQSSPSQKILRQEELLRLAEGLTKLPEAQREAIVLHHLQERKLAEVAAEMGRSEAAVAGLLYRGLKALHQLLGE